MEKFMARPNGTNSIACIIRPIHEAGDALSTVAGRDLDGLNRPIEDQDFGFSGGCAMAPGVFDFHASSEAFFSGMVGLLLVVTAVPHSL